ncbi:nuclear transport factor 2 family protein [Streptacidiphilus sp. 4-A2]|nr:nuclear transport factor 2 family protein [Streptacidiphilus sp. 4-A2]
MSVPVATDMLFDLELFYARQQHRLDTGDVEGFLSDFTEDGSFGVGQAEPLRGRAAIGRAMTALVTRFAETEVTRHHWFGMRKADLQADGVLRVTYYAMVSHTSADGSVRMEPSSVVVDLLEGAASGALRVRSRSITLDLAPAV